ncbi:MAG: hypothetical protein AB7P13_05665 [Candidatus Nitrosocosmicus sp.]
MKIRSLMVIVPLTISLSLILFAGQIQVYNSFGQNSFFNDSNEIGISSNISGITCDRTEHLVYHNHTKLVINEQNKKSLTIPAGIGIVPNECIFWLHTHDDSGIIHVESPTKISFTLGQFLQVWNSFDNSTLINDILKINSQADVFILLENSTIIEPSANIVDIPLQDLAIITLNLKNMTGSQQTNS